MDCSFLNFLFLLDLQTLTSVMEQDELHTSKSSMSTRRQVSHDRFTEAEDGEDEEESNFKEHPEEGEEEEEEVNIRASAEEEAERDGNLERDTPYIT